MARQPNRAGSTGRRGLPLILFYWAGSGRGVVLICPLTTLRPRAPCGLRTPLLPQWVRSVSSRSPASGHSRGGHLRRRSWSGGIDLESRTARLGSIASTCMFVQLAKGITQSRGAQSGPADVPLEASINSEQYGTIQSIVAS